MATSWSTLQDLDRRIRQLEQSAVSLRKGEMTAQGLVLGSASAPGATAIPNVPTVGGKTPPVGSVVRVLTAGGQVLALGDGTAIRTVTTLPASGQDGELLAFYNWVLCYSASAPDPRFPWSVLFGQTRYDYASGSRGGGSASYTAPTSPLSVSLPAGVRGIVDVEIASVGSTVNDAIFQSYTVAGSSASDEWAAKLQKNTTGGIEASITCTYRHTITTAGGGFSERLRTLTGGVGAVAYRSLELRPIWVGP